MRKVVLIPDSFKGTMSSSEICSIMAAAIGRHVPDAEVVQLPVADGGEGSVDAFLAAVGGERVTTTVTGPFAGEPVEAFYGRLPDGTAVIEMAAAAGLPLVDGRQAPDRTTTHGVGGLMLAAAVILQYIVVGTLWVEWHLRIHPVICIGAGLLCAAAAGIGAWGAAAPFLTSQSWHGVLPLLGEVHLSSVLLFDFGVYLLVLGATVLMLVAIAHQSLRGMPRRTNGAP